MENVEPRVKKIVAEQLAAGFSAAPRDGQFERRSGVPMPDLRRVNAVPPRSFAALEQEIDRRRSRAPIDRAGVAEGLAIMPALGVRLEVEQADDVFGGG